MNPGSHHDAGPPHAATPPPRAARRPWAGALLMVAAIAGFFLLREHWGHVLGLAPYLLLLACPLMHLFGHGHHGHGHRHDGGRGTPP